MHAFVAILVICLAGVSASDMKGLVRNTVECNSVLNELIKLELDASHVYLAWAQYFDRDNTAFPGFRRFFLKASDDERSHAISLISYMNKRGVQVQLPAVAAYRVDTKTPVNVFKDALRFEEHVKNHLEKTFKCSDDPHMQHVIQTEMLGEQVDAIDQLSDIIAQLGRLANNDVGVHLFDQGLQK